MWGAFNIFGRKKSEPVEERIVEVKSEHKPMEQPQSSTQTPDPVYAPSPWDEHQAMDGDVPATGVVARAGNPLQPGTELASKEKIGEALKTVYDPEIPVDIYELGLIYEIKIENEDTAKVKMTLTSPNCPVAESLPKDVKDGIMQVEGISKVDLDLVWDPPWNKDMMSEAAKLELNL